MSRFALLALLLPACSGKTSDQPVGDDSGDTNADDTSPDSDTEDSDDGDLDNDGFTVEEGDCDDNNVYASPAREEDDDDDIDNDCDGRINEEWRGLDIAYVNTAGSSTVFTLDIIGRVEDEVTLTDECFPAWLDHADGPLSDGTDGWVINNSYATIASVARDGTCTDFADFSDAELYPNGVYGIATGLDGTVYATTLDKLYTVSADGTITEVASWSCDFEDPAAHEVAVYSLAVDPLTGELGLFGYFGGFATYSPSTGTFSLLATEDLEAVTLYTSSGAHKDGGGWYSPGVDAETGAYGIYRFNLEDSAWVQQETWEDEDWEPFMLAIDGDTGDYYVTANAGWFYTVWRIGAGENYAADLYTTDGTESHRAFYGIVSNY